MQLRYKLFRNSLSSLLQLAVTTVVGLVLPPILLKFLGFEAYGVWALIILVNAYVALIDLGFGSSLVKLTAEAAVVDNREQIRNLMNGSLALYVVIYVAGILLVTLFGDRLMRALLGSAAQRGDYGLLFNAYAVVALTALPTLPFSSLLKGLQRYDQSNVVEILAMLLGTIISVTLIIRGHGLAALVIGAAFAALWRLLTYLWLTRKTYALSQFRWSGYKSFKVTIKELAHLSPADNSVRVYNVVTQTAIRVALNSFAGVAYVGIYDLAKRVVSQISGVSSVVFIPLMPAVSSLAAQKRFESLHELLARCHLYLSMLGMPFFYFMLFFYDPVLTAWLKVDNVASISFAGRLLLITVTLDVFTGPATTSALGLGTARLHLIKMLLSGVLIVTLVFLLGPKFGFSGILVAELCATIAGTFVALRLFQKWFNIPVLTLILKSFWRTSAVNLPVWLVLAGGWFLTRHNVLWQSLATWTLLLSVGVTATVALYWACGLLSAYEVDVVRNAFLPTRSPKLATEKAAEIL
jgi:O-antigen/teichoic acid export membrane protein